MILSSNGIDFEIPGKNLTVSSNQNFSRSDLSGNTSGTEFVANGNKAKEISVSLVMPKKDKAKLRQLVKVAEALTAEGAPTIYTVADELCITLNIREVFFDGEMPIRESANLRAWDVSFSLKEYRSPAEKREARAQASEILGKTSDGKVIAAKPTESMLTNAHNVAKQTINPDETE